MLYTKHIFVKLSVTFFLLLFGLSAFGASKSSIKSKEYKLLLKPSLFKSANADYRKFWAIITRVAKANELEIKEAEKLYDPRMICFLDTKDFSVNKKAFILRVRADTIEASNDEVNSFNDTELTLKYRSPDMASSIISPVYSADGLDSEISMEEDKSIKLGKITSVFSKSGKIYNPKSIPMSVKKVLKFFPGIKKADLYKKAKLQIVNNIMITEKRIRPGYIYIGGEKTKTLFSIWYKNGEQKPLVAEFSFKIHSSKIINKKGLLRTFPAEKAADEFFIQLAKNGAEFLNNKQTKTGLVYQQVEK